MYTFQSNACHERILRERNMQLAFDPAADYGAWKASVIERFRDLIGDMPEKCDLDVRVEWEKEEADFLERRRVYSVIEEIYKKEGAPDNCRLIVGDGGHRFYANLAWGRFREAFLG